MAHLEQITDPEQLRAEPEVVRTHDNTVRLHAEIGYVIPTTNRRPRRPVRRTRRQGLKWARRRRIADHRKHINEQRP